MREGVARHKGVRHLLEADERLEGSGEGDKDATLRHRLHVATRQLARLELRCRDRPRVRVGGTVGLGADGGGAEAHIDGAATARDDDGGGDGAGRQVCGRLFDPLVAELCEVGAADDAAAQLHIDASARPRTHHPHRHNAAHGGGRAVAVAVGCGGGRGVVVDDGEAEAAAAVAVAADGEDARAHGLSDGKVSAEVGGGVGVGGGVECLHLARERRAERHAQPAAAHRRHPAAEHRTHRQIRRRRPRRRCRSRRPREVGRSHRELKAGGATAALARARAKHHDVERLCGWEGGGGARVGEFREVDASDDGALLVETNVELRTAPLRHGRQRVRPYRKRREAGLDLALVLPVVARRPRQRRVQDRVGPDAGVVVHLVHQQEEAPLRRLDEELELRLRCP